MDNKQKQELKEIVREIPEMVLRQNIKTLWRRYAPYYNYGTFRKYLIIFRHEDIKEVCNSSQA